MDSPLQTKSRAFAIRILDMCDFLLENKECRPPYSLIVVTKQIARSGTSIGANIAEANAAQSKADLLSKNSIALKEGRETEYWLSLLRERGCITHAMHLSLTKDLDEIISMLVASIHTLKSKH